MKRLIKVLSVVFLFTLILTGCDNAANKSATSNTKKNHGLVGQTYTGNTELNETTNGKVTIHFETKEKAIMIESGKSTSDNYWGRVIQNVSYKVTKDKKIKFKVLKSYRESYASKNNMDKQATPVFFSSGFGAREKMSLNTLYAGVNYFSFDKDRKKKLYLNSNSVISDFDSYIKNTKKKYYGKETKLSDRGFMSPATELLANGIAFKGRRFIWKYGGPDNEFATDTEQGAQMAVMMGKYELNDNKLILNIQYHSDLYQGTVQQLSNLEFQKYLSGSSIPKKLVFKFTKNNTLHLISRVPGYISDDMLDYGTVDGTPNYQKWVHDENPESYTVGMKKAIDSDEGSDTDDNSSDTSNESDSTDDDSEVGFNSRTGFDSPDDFKQFVINEGMITGFEDEWEPAKAGGEMYRVAESNDTDSETEEQNAYYILTYDSGATYQAIILAANGKIYQGNLAGTLYPVEDVSEDLMNQVNASGK